MAKRIPKAFYSFESKSLFEYCIECEKYLLDDETEYLIEKAIKNYKGFDASDVLFDYAICMDCASKMKDKISSESMAAIVNYFQEHISAETMIGFAEDQEPESLIDHCMIKQTAVEDCGEYQIYAHCKGKNLSSMQAPYMISGEVVEELLPILSKRTKDDMDDFFRKHFSPDPSLFEDSPKLILL